MSEDDNLEEMTKKNKILKDHLKKLKKTNEIINQINEDDNYKLENLEDFIIAYENKKNYSKYMTICENKWGESGWKFIFEIILNSNEENVNKIKQFIFLLEDLLPCEECKKHLKKYIEENLIPDDLLSIFIWLINLENKINIDNKEKERNRFREIKFKTD